MTPARAVLLTAVVLSANVSFAQSTAIDIQLFKPAPGVSDVLNVQGSRVAEPFDWQAGLYLHYANHPLSVVNPNTRENLTRLVSSQTTFDLLGSIGLYKNLELGLHVPLAINGSEPAPFIGPDFADGVGGFGLGDIRLIPKYFILQREELGLAVSLPIVIPSGRSTALQGSGGLGAQPRIVADWTMPNDFRFLANVGVNLRPAHELLNLRVGNEFAFSAGAEIPLKLEGRDLAVLSTINGAVGMPNNGLEEVPAEIILAGRYRILPNLAATLGAGRGITPGYGTPDIRVLFGLMWTETKKKVERQHIEDVETPPEKPVCRNGPEDLDGFKDDDACGDPDNDADGIADAADTCPDDAETKNGHRDTDGCPDEKPQELAALPRAPAGMDTDGDGILDLEDSCATAPEDKDGFEDTDGCPEPDNDRDGIADGTDKCALEAETINGVLDDDGCPDKGKSKVIVKGEKIVILEKVYFATAKDTILPKSFNVLNQVSSVLKANPQIKLVNVEGHTDSQGDDASNMDLSQRRANSVVAFLIKAGVEQSRLKGIGYGETKPVDDNKTAKGRENNRRVEFTIMNDEPVERHLDATPIETAPVEPPRDTHQDGGTP